jgi:hypothetical protein
MLETKNVKIDVVDARLCHDNDKLQLGVSARLKEHARLWLERLRRLRISDESSASSW